MIIIDKPRPLYRPFFKNAHYINVLCSDYNKEWQVIVTFPFAIGAFIGCDLVVLARVFIFVPVLPNLQASFKANRQLRSFIHKLHIQ